MSNTDHTRKPAGMSPISATAIVAAFMLAALVLTACGSSSKATNAATKRNANASASAGGSSAPPSGVDETRTGREPFLAVRECLKKNGIKVPLPGRADVPPPGGPVGAGGPPAGNLFLNRQLPKGVTRAQFQAALQKCGRGHFFRDGRPFSGPGSASPRNPMFRQALSKFAQCLRHNGINVPDPNTSGHGPIFSTKGLEPNSPKFKEAASKCRGVLFGAFRAGARPPAGANR